MGTWVSVVQNYALYLISFKATLEMRDGPRTKIFMPLLFLTRSVRAPGRAVRWQRVQHGERTLAAHSSMSREHSAPVPSPCAGVIASQGSLEGKSGNTSPACCSLAHSGRVVDTAHVEELVVPQTSMELAHWLEMCLSHPALHLPFVTLSIHQACALQANLTSSSPQP